MNGEFELHRRRGETGIPPSPYLAAATSGTAAISPVDVRSWRTHGTLPVGPRQIYGIGRIPSPTGYHIEKGEFNDFRHGIIAKLETISDRLSDLEKKIESFSTIPKVVVIEEISREEAKKRISECLNEIDEKIYPSEIAERLHIDYDLCVEIIEELLKEGKIEIVEV